MNKKLVVIVIIVLIILAGWYLYSTSYNVAPTSGEPIKIGAIFILSGEGASWGEASRNGMQLAIDELNKKGGVNGRPLEGIYEDNQSEPTKAISAFNKLVSSDKVKFIVGPNWSNSGLPLVDLAKNQKVVIISPSLGVKEFNEANEYLFNVWPHDYILSGKLGEYVYDRGYRNIALIGAQDVWVKDQTKAVKDKFEARGGQVSYIYEPNTATTDLRTEITKIKANRNVQAIVLTTDGYGLTAIAARQIREMGINLPLFNITVDNKILADCSSACEEMIFPTFLTPTKQFESKYKSSYNREVEIGADSAYDAVMMLAEAMEKTNSTDPERVKDYLASIKNYSGVSGRLVSDGNRGFTKDLLMKVVKGGKAEDLK